METLLRNVRYGVRSLLKRPGFTSIAVLSLALGIGACTAIFSVVDGALLRSLPYPDAQRLVQLREVNAAGGRSAFTEPNFIDVRDRSQTLEAVAEYSSGLATVSGGSEPARVITSRVSADFFRVLGIRSQISDLRFQISNRREEERNWRAAEKGMSTDGRHK
jgi:putative ABC transport system permease protein